MRVRGMRLLNINIYLKEMLVIFLHILPLSVVFWTQFPVHVWMLGLPHQQPAILRYQWSVQEFNSILTLSGDNQAWRLRAQSPKTTLYFRFWLQIIGKSLLLTKQLQIRSPHDPQIQMPFTSPGYFCTPNQLATNQSFPGHPPLSTFSLQNRENIYSLNHNL